MIIPEFVVPSFLKNQSTEEIMERMLGNIDDKFDKSEGGFAWDLCFPNAIEKSEMAEYILPQIIKNMFPMWCSDDMLDAHGQPRKTPRKEAQYAIGYVTITGSVGALIEQGTIVSTTAVMDDDETVDFVTLADAVVGNSGSVDVGIIAATAGILGNVAIGAINRFEDAPDGVTGVTNPFATTGGVDEESEDSYRERIVEYDRNQGASFIGSQSDYHRWAMSVDGVSSAKVITPEDQSGIVTIVITGPDGQTATNELMDDVYNHIMRPDNGMLRLAPPDARLNVIAPTLEEISISATLSLTSSATLGGVKTAFLTGVLAYFAEISDRTVRYNKIGEILMATPGVVDYTSLLVNGDISNIQLDSDDIATTNSGLVVFEQ